MSVFTVCLTGSAWSDALLACRACKVLEDRCGARPSVATSSVICSTEGRTMTACLPKAFSEIGIDSVLMTPLKWPAESQFL